MKNKSGLIFFYTIFFLFAEICAAQNSSSDFYRSAENKFYWKNRPPYTGYWQQDVHYIIKAEVDDMQDIITGNEQLTYFNNSPDTLFFVYFHLYQNAFQPGSYLDQLTKANGTKPRYSKWEKQKKGTVIEYVIAEDQSLRTELDNTILKVFLPKPLLPQSSMKFDIAFKTYYGGGGSQRRRMAVYNVWGHKHYNGVQWYPKISVYDHKFGWTADQHLNREFYGDYGSFDVELTFPNVYVVDATGILQNEKEVLPDTLRKKLDIANFKDTPWNFPPSLPIIPDSTKKTWKYHADNVHDFAFTADPTYRIGEVEWNGIKCIALAQESHSSRWQNAASYAAKIIKTYSEDFGMYAWPKIIVADAQDGMEYPMLTLDGGGDPSFRNLFCHEVGHQWFYGMVGNNETYRAALDEGFTQFLTAWSMEKLEGKYGKRGRPQKGYANHFRDSVDQVMSVAYYGYLIAAIQGDDGFINTHSDNFSGALGHGGGYGMVYRKTATMLYNLQYVLGDELFLNAMKHYFSQWKFCHPYFEDFRNSIINFTHVDLNWFFDEWMETNKRIDYKVQCVKHGKEKDDYIITFKRKERMQMPIDFTVYADDGKKYDYHIPNRWFVKNTSATVLPKWFGWDKLNQTYSATVHIPAGIDNVVIDTTNRLADIKKINNSYKFPLRVKFDSQIANLPDWNHYVLKARPDFWYNNYDGIKAGAHIDGNYFNYSHFFDFNFWVNTDIAQGKLPLNAELNKNDAVSFTFRYHTPMDKLVKNSSVNLSAKMLDGLIAYSGGAELSPRIGLNFYLSFNSFLRKNIAALNYLLYPDEWAANKNDNTVKLGVTCNYRFLGINNFDFNLRSSSFGSSYDYSYLTLSQVNRNDVGKIFLRTRLYLQYGMGTNFATESSLYLAGANQEELMNDKFTRSHAYVPEEWLGYDVATNHFQQGGGLNLRGYAGYLGAQPISEDNVRYFYRGNSGGAINAELDFSRLFNFHPKFTRNWLGISTYLFADAGVINYDYTNENFALTDIRSDAGVGVAVTIKKFGPLETVKPFTLRFDMPLFLGNPPNAEGDYIKWRWVVGVGRCF